MAAIDLVSVAMIPLMMAGILLVGILKKVKVFDSFVNGAKEGVETSVRIIAPLIGLLTAIAMLRASGALDFLSGLLGPALAIIKFPKDVLPLALMRPISGSGALAIVNDAYKTFGVDSYIGKVASIMMGCTETTFYTLAIYFGSVGVYNTRYTVKAALLGDLAAILASVYICMLIK